MSTSTDPASRKFRLRPAAK